MNGQSILHVHVPSAYYNPQGNSISPGRREFDILQDASAMFQALTGHNPSGALACGHLEALRSRLVEFEEEILPVFDRIDKKATNDDGQAT